MKCLNRSTPLECSVGNPSVRSKFEVASIIMSGSLVSLSNQQSRSINHKGQRSISIACVLLPLLFRNVLGFSGSKRLDDWAALNNKSALWPTLVTKSPVRSKIKILKNNSEASLFGIQIFPFLWTWRSTAFVRRAPERKRREKGREKEKPRMEKQRGSLADP